MSKAAELAALIGSQSPQSHRNILINGAMQVAQRGTSLAVAHDGVTGGYLIDRWNNALGGTHEQLDATYAQVADHPLSANGKSLKWTTGTAESSYDADEYLYFAQLVEAQHLQHLNYGNSNAQSVTLSFYVKSSVTGTFACNLYKEDSTARIINKTYAISSANTWEKKIITFPADTGGGGIVNDNGIGLYVVWHLAAGSGIVGGGSNGAWKNYGGLTDWADGQATNAVATTASATWQMTDCQLELGEQATPFEHRSFGDDYAACQRYYFKMGQGVGGLPTPSGGYFRYAIGACQGSTTAGCMFFPPVPMRAVPTLEQTGTAGDYALYEADSVHALTGVPAINSAQSSHTQFNVTASSSGNLASGNAVEFMNNNSGSAYLAFSAEL